MRDVKRLEAARKRHRGHGRRGCRCAEENPTLLDHANNAVGDFVNDHPWISALIGGTALGAAGYIGVLITQAVIRQTPASSTITTSDTSTGPTSTSTSTSGSSSSTSTSGGSSTSSTSSPTYSASKAKTVSLQSGGTSVAVGDSLVVVDSATGQPVNVSAKPVSSYLQPNGRTPVTVTVTPVDPSLVVAAGPTTGTFVAIGAGLVKLVAPDGTSTVVDVKASSGTAGVAISPKRPMPKLRGLTSLLVGPALASGG